MVLYVSDGNERCKYGCTLSRSTNQKALRYRDRGTPAVVPLLMIDGLHDA